VSPETKEKVKAGVDKGVDAGKEFYSDHEDQIKQAGRNVQRAGQDWYKAHQEDVDRAVQQGKGWYGAHEDEIKRGVQHGRDWVRDHREDIRSGVQRGAQYVGDHQEDIVRVTKQIVSNIQIPPELKAKAENLMEQLMKLLMGDGSGAGVATTLPAEVPGKETKPAAPATSI